MEETVETHAAGLLAIQLHPNHISMVVEFKPRFEDRGLVYGRVLQVFDTG
jgi:hypothetical protein